MNNHNDCESDSDISVKRKKSKKNHDPRKMSEISQTHFEELSDDGKL